MKIHSTGKMQSIQMLNEEQHVVTIWLQSVVQEPANYTISKFKSANKL